MVKLVLLVLVGFSFLSWAVIVERFRLYRRASRNSQAFLNAIEQTRNLADLKDRCDAFRGSPLVSLFTAGFNEFTSQVMGPDGARFRNSPSAISEAELARRVDRIRRVLEQRCISENDKMEAFLPVLATTGSVTPFVGLFGTVWGIMNAFQEIGLQGSASLAAVAPGISEALIATAMGLAAAIPAVVGYNYFLGRLRGLNSQMDEFVMKFTTIVERHLEEVPAVSPREAGEGGA